MQHLNVLPLGGVERHILRFRIATQLADHFGVAVIVFVADHASADVLAGDQARVVPHGVQFACPVVGTRASLDTDGRRRQLDEKLQ